MIMEKIVSFKNINVKISCDYIMDIEKYIPIHYEIKDYSDEKVSKTMIIKIKKNPEIKWNEEYNELTFYVNELNKQVYNSIIVLLNVLIKRALQEEGKYILHASGVIVDDRIVLLFGSSGSGKTATAMSLASCDNVSFLSNGSIIVSFNKGIVKVCGTYKKGIKIRKSTLKQYNKEICSKIFGQENDEKSFDCKMILSPEQMGFRNAMDKDIEKYDKIEFYIIQLDSLNTQLKHRIDFNYKLSMQLYEDLNREINGSEVYININNKPIYVPSLDTKELCINRINFINHFMKNYFSGVLMGGLQELQSKILIG